MTGRRPVLLVPDEPADLRASTRALAQQQPARAAALISEGEWIAPPLWQAWGAELERHGIDRAGMVGVAAGYQRELWLWVMGERTWTQCAGGLAGRLERRVPAEAAPDRSQAPRRAGPGG